MMASRTMTIRESIHPALAKTPGSVSAPVPTIRLKMNMKPTCG